MERTSSHFRDVIMKSNIWRKRAEVKAEEDFKSLNDILALVIKKLIDVEERLKLNGAHFLIFWKNYQKHYEKTAKDIKDMKKNLEVHMAKKNWKVVLRTSTRFLYCLATRAHWICPISK